MINALSAGISGKEPRVSAEVLRSYYGDSVTQYLDCGAMLKNNCIIIENHDGLTFCHVCYCAAQDRLGRCLFAQSIIWNELLFFSSSNQFKFLNLYQPLSIKNVIAYRN